MTDPPLEVDADLRPEGKQGPLVRTLDSYAAYYAKWSKVWEFQALLRADAVVGDEDLRRRFTELIDPLRFPAGGRHEADVAEVRRVKARIDRERLPRGADPNTHLKLGRGGLADIEWTVQLLQMRHAGAVPGLRTPRTLDALGAAARGGTARGRRRRRAGPVVAHGQPGAQRHHVGAGEGQRPAAARPADEGRDGRRPRLSARRERRDAQRLSPHHPARQSRCRPGVLGVIAPAWCDCWDACDVDHRTVDEPWTFRGGSARRADSGRRVASARDRVRDRTPGARTARASNASASSPC